MSSISAPEGLKDSAYVRILQCKTELNTEESETHVPDLPEAELWFLVIHVAPHLTWKLYQQGPERAPDAIVFIHRIDPLSLEFCW